LIREESIRARLKNIFTENTDILADEIIRKIVEFNEQFTEREDYILDEKKSILITYADSLQGEDVPLETLREFLNEKIGNSINTVHILPFFPYSSDDGFSVVNYTEVNPDFGSWEEIHSLSSTHKIMFDAVINHISSKSSWFRGYLNGEKKYIDYFIESDPETDLSTVTRPRTFPLLSEFETERGKKYLWTTFSDDQIDLNYKSQNLLFEVIEVLLFYAANGASLIRLDAVGYIWKEVGTSCIHLDKAHEIIKLMRDILDSLNKKVLIITETNVPHKDNISYFGNGTDEAQMIYNFSLPPLVLNAYQIHSSEHLSKWASALTTPSSETTFFNFLASHDGIGLMPVKDFLSGEEIDNLVIKTENNGGKISWKTNSDGSLSPYEMNINYFDALYDCTETEEENIRKFLGAYFIACSLSGIPGIYIHSLVGSRNWTEGVNTLGYNRAINREKLCLKKLEKELSDSNSRRHKIFTNMIRILSERQNHPAFSPKAEQEIIELDNRLFCIKRSSVQETILSIVNLSRDEVRVELEENCEYYDVIAQKHQKKRLIMAPYKYLWIRVE